MLTRPKLGTLVVRFFVANPDEELTSADVCAKFGADPRGLRARLGYHLNTGELVRDGDIYRPGPALPSAVVSTPDVCAERSRRGKRSRYERLLASLAEGEVKALPIEHQRSVSKYTRSRMARLPDTRFAVRKLNATTCCVVRLEAPGEHAR